jgi:transposase
VDAPAAVGPTERAAIPSLGLTEAEWERVHALLPPQQPVIGRRRHDHRAVLSGILWVFRSAAPWREMPVEFGKWNTAYVRYRLWREQGLWQRIIEVLGSDAAFPVPERPP